MAWRDSWALDFKKDKTYKFTAKGRIGWKGLRSDEFLELSDSYVVTEQILKMEK
jgi:type I restriction enzyme S subunit